MANSKNTFISIVLVLILGVAALLRFVNLNSLPIFADESIYVRWSQVMRAESTLRFLPLSDGKQPLFMWTTIPFLKLFADPLLAGRVLSGLSGLGIVLGIGFVSFILFKNYRQSFLSLILAAVIPYLVFFNRMALVDSLLTMFMVWAFIFSLLSVLHQRLDWAMFSGFCLGFAWLTKSPAVFAFFILPLNWLFLPKYSFKNICYAIFCLLVSLTIAFGMYNILRLGPEFHMIALRNKDYLFPISEVLQHPTDPLIPHLKDSFQFYLYFMTPVSLLVLTWVIFGEKFYHFRQRFVLLSWLLVPIIAESAIAKQFTARYLLFTTPFAVILIAHGIEHLGQRTQKHVLVWLTFLLIVIPSLVVDYLFLVRPESAPLPRIERSGYLEEWTAGYGLKDISLQLREYAKTSPILVGSEGYFGTPFDALQLYTNNIPNIRVIGVGVWIDSVDPKLKSALKENRVFLVVNSTRLHVDPDKIGLRLIASYPKAFRPDGTREYLLFFEVKKQ